MSLKQGSVMAGLESPGDVTVWHLERVTVKNKYTEVRILSVPRDDNLHSELGVCFVCVHFHLSIIEEDNPASNLAVRGTPCITFRGTCY